MDSDPQVMKYLTGGVAHTREAIVEKILPRYLSFYDRFEHFGYWAAIEKASGSFIGWFHFRPNRETPREMELGYRLKAMYWGHGYATEGSAALIDKGFRELGVEKAVAVTMALNQRSRHVMEKIGLRFEKTFAYPGKPFPGWRSEDCLEVKYGLTRTQWASSTCL